MVTTVPSLAERFADAPLVSNGYALSTSPERLGHLTPSDPGRPKAELVEQLRAQGYLWLRGILDRERVLAVRRRYFEMMDGTGLVAPDSDPTDGIFSYGEVARDRTALAEMHFLKSAAYESFCLTPAIVALHEAILGEPAHLLNRKIVRAENPGGRHCTGGHYDLVYLRAGTDRVFTSWIPIGDTPIEMGGLTYLEGSDAMGRRLESEFTVRNAELSPEERISAFNRNMAEGGWITKDLPALADQADARWLVADYEAGDMMIHTAYILHAATSNRDAQGRIRLSTDIRYQAVADHVDARWESGWEQRTDL